MSTTIHNENEQCCTIPPVVVEGYEPKGTYKAYGPFKKAYLTGNPQSDKVIIYIFDVFGFSTQSLQGADILAESTGALVVEPDYFPDGVLDHETFANKTPENQAKIQAWWGKYGDFTLHIGSTEDALKTARDGGAKKTGIAGFCFGGKVATITATDATKVDAIAVVHPARVAVEDADKLAVPIGFFPSQGESAEDCKTFLEAVSKKPFASKNVVKRYDDMHHGWAGARANLKDEANLKQYKDVFEELTKFFNNTLA